MEKKETTETTETTETRERPQTPIEKFVEGPDVVEKTTTTEKETRETDR